MSGLVPDPKVVVECALCETTSVDKVDYCYGCRHYVCDACGVNISLMGPHEVDDHSKSEEYDEESE